MRRLLRVIAAQLTPLGKRSIWNAGQRDYTHFPLVYKQKEATALRKIGMVILGIVLITLTGLTVVSAHKVLEDDLTLPRALSEKQDALRFVLITQDLDTPFWDKVSQGAKQAADELDISLEVWGSYGNQQESFLKQIEIAIHGQVDGIIVQGLDTEEFKELTKVKASFYGVPIITIANDVPMEESLRKTYVGSDQHAAGKMIVNQLIKEMGNQGEMVLLYDTEDSYYQTKRIEGMESVLSKYPSIKIHHAKTESSREQIKATTQTMLNLYPNAKAFIAVNAAMAGPLVQEISKRYQIDPFYLYSFDDGAESTTLLEQGKLDAIIEQEPTTMGEVSVRRLAEWVKGETIPLNREGYFTNIRVTKEKAEHE